MNWLANDLKSRAADGYFQRAIGGSYRFRGVNFVVGAVAAYSSWGILM